MIARTQKQPRYPLTDEWIKKVVVHIHNGILLSHKKHVQSDLVRWMDLEPILQYEVGQKEKNILY